jgi:hypothetical protein
MLTEAVDGVATDIVIAFEVAGDPVAQARPLAIMHVITSLLASVVEV